MCAYVTARAGGSVLRGKVSLFVLEAPMYCLCLLFAMAMDMCMFGGAVMPTMRDSGKPSLHLLGSHAHNLYSD